MLKQDPVTLYGPNGQNKSIPAVDAPGWLAAGWSVEESRGDEGDGELGGDEGENIDTPVPSPSTPPKRKKIVAENGAGNSLSES
ncbi:hypothetical protein [Dendronalium sp. ChiSLP03b]|uniref:hypothetical protein n=1 Tax=Dendronalium sp. ChiSLP03b TaxID=3075381 RepID=UPI00391CA2C6